MFFDHNLQKLWETNAKLFFNLDRLKMFLLCISTTSTYLFGLTVKHCSRQYLVIGSKILRILKAHGLAPEILEDLYHLIKKAVAIRKHLERNRKDKDSKFRLILVGAGFTDLLITTRRPRSFHLSGNSMFPKFYFITYFHH
ncbi:unnamed protein product [Lactuca virosa]|uniref:40S ribosomal protein S13 n=1 Tax=Lactuca virosa TaxID=75947 RepID=A0AAU9M370_9ASTR|nr:unnamed protein product [Lactuca virosa]